MFDTVSVWRCIATTLLLNCITLPVLAKSQDLTPVVNGGKNIFKFDWPAISIGTATYEEGPTGVTVINFNKRSAVAVDVRGGSPGTVNAAYIDMGKDEQELDAIVFAGGSWYGLEAVTAVATALKDDGIRSGDVFGTVPNIAMSVGSIIFDFGSRRLNEVYPDKKLAQAAFRAAKTGRFAQGAEGAGRFTKSGGFFGCHAFSGQGASFQQIGNIKIAAFIVANPYGLVVDREGKLAACYNSKNWPDNITASQLLRNFPSSTEKDWTGPNKQRGGPKNTTVSLIVTNQKLSAVDLKRLAVQVHTSLGRGIQPFTTLYDGDVMYAVSTNEVEAEYSLPGLGVIASELMWDALLNSVPEQQPFSVPSKNPILSAAQLRELEGEYRFSDIVSVTITADGEKLYAQATGEKPAYNIAKNKKTELLPVSKSEFMALGRTPHTIQFKGGNMIMNPGHWAQKGQKTNK